MILADTSVWIDHFRAHDEKLAALLDKGRILAHPFFIGELALGHLRQREIILGALLDLPQAIAATDAETFHLIAAHMLHGRGIGYLDAHLLASARLTSGARLWTHDRRLHDVADALGVAA